MIQLATAPNASATSYRPAPNDGKGSTFAAPRGRTARAWPFPSRYAARATQPQSQEPTASDSGS
jgi:homogentisate 1,2-dioxygenase